MIIIEVDSKLQSIVSLYLADRTSPTRFGIMAAQNLQLPASKPRDLCS